MAKKLRAPELAFQTAIAIVAILFALLCVYPLYYILMYALSDPNTVSSTKVFFTPHRFTLYNFSELLGRNGIIASFLISVSRALLGTAVTITTTGLFAHVLMKQKLPFRRFFYRATIASMYVGAGLIPWYITMLRLGLKDNYLLYILPYTINAYYLILIKTYMESLPAALEESASIDGAGLFTIFFRILIPLCTPIIAATAVFSAVMQWNTWVDNFYLINNTRLFTLQYNLYILLNRAESIANQIIQSGGSMEELQKAITPTSVRMTITMIAAIPIIMVYPFMQRFFVKGIMLGAVKG